ncbi:MAG TPA: 1,4-alpha-glucan branching protein GlgB, partial [Ruminococcaceae bacterium]|nr:1,4-alpha-glucan branching protein GlgB [Oscillospiraceae bacterium]
ADPFGYYAEVRPATASRIWSLDGFTWTDREWMQSRSKNYNQPMSIYEVHLGSWKTRRGIKGAERFYSYDDLVDTLLPYVKQQGFTHIELLPLTEHPLDASWGYQVSGYFSATSRYGTPQQLMHFIDCCHREKIGVIMDFVPAHFIRDNYALSKFDGTYLYESADSSLRNSEWGTVFFDFTKSHVVSFLKSAVDFWLTCYHFDGIRYDAVSRLIYTCGQESRGINEAGLWFLRSTNYAMQTRHPSAMLIAEDSTNFLKVTAPVEYGGLGFDYKWDLGWMNDSLDYMMKRPDERPAFSKELTFSMDYFYKDIFLLPLSHDEVVHGKKTIIDKIYGS